MSWQRLALLLAAIAATSGCGGDRATPEPSSATSSDGLSNSEIDEGHPSVVTFRAQGFIFCTGTVIAPRVVVTAGHCLDTSLTGVTPTEIEVFFGTDPKKDGTYIRVVEGEYHPGYRTDDLYSGYDIGLMRLAEDAPAVSVPIIGSAPQPGTELTLVGFGESSSSGGGGVKRWGTATVIELNPKNPNLFDINAGPSALCHGDSGGPALLDVDGVETIVGVGSLGSCAGTSVEQRLDIVRDTFIRPWTTTCAGDGLCAEACSEPDPDCPCADDGLCTAACSEPGKDPDCPPCIADGACNEGCPGEADPDCETPPSPSGGAGGKNADAPVDDDGGCAVGGAPRGGTPPGAWLIALAVGSVVRRRSASCRRRACNAAAER